MEIKPPKLLPEQSPLFFLAQFVHQWVSGGLNGNFGSMLQRMRNPDKESSKRSDKASRAIAVFGRLPTARPSSTSNQPHPNQTDVHLRHAIIHRLTSHVPRLIINLRCSLAPLFAPGRREDNDSKTCPLPHPLTLPTNPIETPSRLSQILLLHLRQNRAVKRSAVEVHLPEANPGLPPHLQTEKLSAVTGL